MYIGQYVTARDDEEQILILLSESIIRVKEMQNMWLFSENGTGWVAPSGH